VQDVIAGAHVSIGRAAVRVERIGARSDLLFRRDGPSVAIIIIANTVNVVAHTLAGFSVADALVAALQHGAKRMADDLRFIAHGFGSVATASHESQEHDTHQTPACFHNLKL